jgi:hypothetical protein
MPWFDEEDAHTVREKADISLEIENFEGANVSLSEKGFPLYRWSCRRRWQAEVVEAEEAKDVVQVEEAFQAEGNVQAEEAEEAVEAEKSVETEGADTLGTMCTICNISFSKPDSLKRYEKKVHSVNTNREN